MKDSKSKLGSLSDKDLKGGNEFFASKGDTLRDTGRRFGRVANTEAVALEATSHELSIEPPHDGFRSKVPPV